MLFNTNCTYEQLLKRYYDGYKEEIRFSTRCIYPLNWIYVMKNPELLRWLEWVNINICLTIFTDKYKWNKTEVLLRIATGMLNKLESLTDLEKIQIHMNLTQNILNEKSKLICEDLPF